MADINLLPYEERASERLELLKSRLQFLSVGFLVLTAILTLLTLGLFAAFTSKRSEIVVEVEDASLRINQLKANEELLVVVKDKISTADKILALRTEYPGVFEKLANLVPQGVYFTDIRVLGGKVVISGKAKTSADVSGLASSLVSAKGAEIVSGIAIDSLSSDAAGKYTFAISAFLVETNKGSGETSNQSLEAAGE